MKNNHSKKSNLLNLLKRKRTLPQMKNNILRQRADLSKLNPSLKPIYPTQEVIDISSSSDDEPKPTPIQVLIPKAEVDRVSSLRAKRINYGTAPQPTQEERLLTTQLSGPRFLEAMRYQFMSMRPRQYIDIQVVSIMCHTLNMEQSEWFQKQVYCVPPEILPKLKEFMKDIVAKIMLSESNAWGMETMRKANRMRNIRPVPVLRSPYLQVSSTNLPSK
ncbi:hypothetical protein PIB30_090699 [Stylosanthes scabra]|uniref:Uncharacterized protein n=1 Tax=Stylosanthes scabra TaxID=79078 RepID=A0ABU6VUJ3_9FABA|nr:hypothetical protein [Stylosanthes scabra]